MEVLSQLLTVIYRVKTAIKKVIKNVQPTVLGADPLYSLSSIGAAKTGRNQMKMRKTPSSREQATEPPNHINYSMTSSALVSSPFI
jgi:hypothetical protein